MTNEFKRMQQIAGLFIESEIEEAKGDSKLNAIADLYAYRGIESKYDDEAIERYGKNTVRMAEELAPRILAFMEEMKEVKNKIENSSEGKMLKLIVKNQLEYDGARRGGTMLDIFNLIDSY
jgi:predicted hydrocarbon binding protein